MIYFYYPINFLYNFLFIQSVQFHESGKRHKANVEARIKEIGKKSIADQKAKLKLDNDIRKMEEVNHFFVYIYLFFCNITRLSLRFNFY